MQHFLLFLTLVVSVLLSCKWDYNTDSTDANTRSSSLEENVNSLRTSDVEISKSMRFLAQLHVDDLELKWDKDNDCNGYRTWSGSEEGSPWKEVCDEDDGSVADLSEKANELTGFSTKAKVYEAVVRMSYGSADASKCKKKLNNVKEMREMVKNKGDYEKITWKGMGCGYSKKFCSCWFSTVEDTVNRNFTCSDGVAASSTEVCGGGAGTGICVEQDKCMLWEAEEEN